MFREIESSVFLIWAEGRWLMVANPKVAELTLSEGKCSIIGAQCSVFNAIIFYKKTPLYSPLQLTTHYLQLTIHNSPFNIHNSLDHLSQFLPTSLLRQIDFFSQALAVLFNGIVTDAQHCCHFLWRQLQFGKCQQTNLCRTDVGDLFF